MHRIGVRALPESDSAGKPLVLWSVEDITRDRERQDNAFLELQRAIDYLDHAPAGFFSADAEGRIQYLNSTLADWLGYDLAEFETDAIRLDDIVRGDGASLLMRGRSDGEIRTEIDRHRPGAPQHTASGAPDAPRRPPRRRRTG